MKLVREKSFGEWLAKFIVMMIATVIMAVAAAFFYVANIQPSSSGMNSLGVFTSGIEITFNISYGTATIIVNSLLVLISIIFMRKNIYFGTIVQIFALGPIIDIFIPFISLLSAGVSDIVRVIVFPAIGIVIYSAGIAMYLPLNWGAAPIDGIILILYEKTPLPYKLSFAICCLTVALTGFFLGATIGYSTIIAAIAMGYITGVLINPFGKILKKLKITGEESFSV